MCKIDKFPPWLFSCFFWFSATVVCFFLSIYFVVYIVDPFIKSAWTKFFEKAVEIPFWISAIETVVMSTMGVFAICYFEKLVADNLRKVHEKLLGELSEYYNKLITDNLREVHQELMEKLGKDSHDNAYFAYHTIINHTAEMKSLVNMLVKLPQHPDILKVLIEDYSKKATESKFLVDFPTFLKLGEIFVQHSNQMCLVNTTPPYEWWYPIRFSRNRDIESAIQSYKDKIEVKLKDDSKVSRITIVNRADNNTRLGGEIALTSVLEHGFYSYFNKLGIDVNSREKDDDIAKPIVAWMQDILKEFKGKLSSSDSTLNNVLEIVNRSDSPIVRLDSFLSKYFNPTKSEFKNDFKKLSRDISLLLLKNFVFLHNPPENAFYILKDKVSDSKKDDIADWAKEEGIYSDSAGNLYLMRIEEENGMNVLLVTIKHIEEEDQTNFKRLEYSFLKASAERGATGTLQELLKRKECEDVQIR